ncbi:glucose PTS transporter subunit IIA, partial [Enterococcus faecalis]|uniref:glucose PTS transporter subunit IIA n=2 Tax=Enterococcus TaxID=1350 RepID=UPI00177A8F1C
ISGIFTPLMPAIIGSGLIKGLMALFVVFGWLSVESSSYAVLNVLSDGVFYFLPFLVAMTAARKFKTKESLAVALAGMLMYPTLVNGAADGASPLSMFGLSIPLNNYSSTVLPIILGVLLLSVVNKWMDKIVPKTVNIVFSPMLSLLITAPILLAFVAPLGNFLGKYLEQIFTTLFNVTGPLAGLLMGGLMPLIVLTGMHYAFFPGTFASLQKFGYDIMLLPMNLVANSAQAGAVLGVSLKSKRAETKSLAFSTFIPAVFGITEPAIYGVTLRLKKPFYASLIGGGVGGTIFGFFAVKATAFSIPGITALPTYIMKNSNNFIYAVIGYIASFVVSFVLTMLWGFEEDEKEETTDKKTSSLKSIPQESNQPIEIFSPMKGSLIPLEAVSDETFSSGMMGKGVAIKPLGDTIYAPFDGEITMTTPTNHAIGLRSVKGAEVLIHVGIDTVNLQGKYFERFVSEGETINKGQPLLRYNLKEIVDKGYDETTMVIVTNSAEFLDIIITGDENVESKTSRLMMCIQ